MPLGGAALVAGALWYGLSRRSKTCPNCRARLELLTEQADDEYLEPAARLEEILGSLNYQVYRCKNCNHHQIEPHRRWFSGYETCPDCQRVTLKETQTSLKHPTTRREGLALLTQDCQHCQHHSERQVHLPRLEEKQWRSSSFHGNDSQRRQTFTGMNSGFDSSRSDTSRASSSREPSGGGRSSGGGASGDW